MHNAFAAVGHASGEPFDEPERHPDIAPLLSVRGPLTVAHVTTSLDTGGAQAMLAKLVTMGGSRAGSDIRHCVLSLMRPGSMAEPLHACGCPVYGLGMGRGWPTPLSLLRLVRACGAVEPDLLQGWMYHGNLAALAAGMFGSFPVIWNVRHSLADLRRENASTRTLLHWSAQLSRRPRAIIYNSRASAAEHERIGFSSERAVVIPNGFDCRRFAPERSRRLNVRSMFGIAEGPTVVAMVARCHPMKDHMMLVRAVQQARASGCDLHLLLVGPGLEQPPVALARLIACALPSDRVTLSGERLDVDQWLSSVDILALSSAWGEAFPNILGEAMACGIPCVTTDVGDSAWIVGNAGTAVPPGDSAAMAAALIGLVHAGAEGRRVIGRLGRARILDQFNLAGITDRYARLYDRVLAEPEPAGEFGSVDRLSPDMAP